MALRTPGKLSRFERSDGASAARTMFCQKTREYYNPYVPEPGLKLDDMSFLGSFSRMTLLLERGGVIEEGTTRASGDGESFPWSLAA